MPPDVMYMITSAPLSALAKKDRGVRPIGVGETLRRLVSKCMNAHLQPVASAQLSPTQVGVGERGGCEAILTRSQQLSQPTATQMILSCVRSILPMPSTE